MGDFKPRLGGHVFGTVPQGPGRGGPFLGSRTATRLWIGFPPSLWEAEEGKGLVPRAVHAAGTLFHRPQRPSLDPGLVALGGMSPSPATVWQ